MNVKGVFGAIIPTQVRPVERVERGIKSDNSSSDRDANGQYSQDSGQKKHGRMNDEQKKKALEHLRQLAVVKDNNLTVTWTEHEGLGLVLIQDPTGKTVRRIPEEELWDLQSVKDNEKGQLLRKSA